MSVAPLPKSASAISPSLKRPAHLAQGRWLGDLNPLSAAEERLVKACAEGTSWYPERWDGETRPSAPTSANVIRADLIRFLLLGGDESHPVHEEGVIVSGAWISGMLNLHQAHCPVRLDLRYCHLAATPVFIAATLAELSLIGCAVPGLYADKLIVAGGVYLDNGFSSWGEVRLLNGEIGGALQCSGGTFLNAEGIALNVDSLKVKGSLFLRDGFSTSG